MALLPTKHIPRPQKLGTAEGSPSTAEVVADRAAVESGAQTYRTVFDANDLQTLATDKEAAGVVRTPINPAWPYGRSVSPINMREQSPIAWFPPSDWMFKMVMPVPLYNRCVAEFASDGGDADRNLFHAVLSVVRRGVKVDQLPPAAKTVYDDGVSRGWDKQAPTY
ncbi:hypothetical protein NG895_12315 [Aeoliella sp. ICT_H6.2]|uniref:Uncharacterized protein n=1 Tax=Aeoliella straminimaris TaxID=2954799 RepID=A0A9X2FAL8_9BACT|nr:hypothetical protein [Aeoliella straminimaris]MCO6044693.1 hypothetical protein [Aeoliella straminimaris]